MVKSVEANEDGADMLLIDGKQYSPDSVVKVSLKTLNCHDFIPPNGISALSFTEGLQVLGNNIANAGSVSCKSSRVNYSDNFYLHLNKAEAADGAPSNNLHNMGTGVHVGAVSSNFSQGVIENTAIDLDVAIDGEALPNAGDFSRWLILPLAINSLLELVHLMLPPKVN